MTHDEMIDLATFLTLCALWSGFVVLAIKRSREWTPASTAVTIVLAVQALREANAAARLVNPDLLPDEVRTVIRVALIAAALYTMVAVKRDRPPRPPIVTMR